MDRVSTLMNSQALLAGLTQSQRTLFDAQTVVTTGKTITAYSDQPSALNGLLAAKSVDAETANYQTTATAVQNRLDVQDTNLGQISSIASDLRKSVLEAVANGSGVAVKATLASAFDQIKSILNTQVDGKYIYGGTRQDVPPVAVNSLSELTALGSTATAFQNNAVAPSATIAQGQTISYGQLASDLGQPIFDAIRQIAAFDGGSAGPLGTTLTTAQSSFLSSQLQGLTSATQSLNAQQAENGVAASTVKDVLSRHSDTRDTLASFISNVEDADMPTAISKLNDAQTALQASAKAYATIQSMTLLNFLSS